MEKPKPMSNNRNAEVNWAIDNGSEARFSWIFGLQVPIIQKRLSLSKSPKMEKSLNFKNSLK